MIIGGSGSGKTNPIFNLINQQSHIDKIYLYAKDRYEAKYQFLIKKSILMILKSFLNTLIIRMIFTKIFKKTIQIKNVKY